MVEGGSQSGADLRSQKRKKKVNRVSKGEGSLYLRGRVWWYKSPDGTSRSTGRKIKSEAVEWKQKFLAECCNREGRIPTERARATVTVNEVLDDYVAYLTLKARKSVKIIAQVLDANIRPVFGDRQPASLTTSDFQRYREKTRNRRRPRHGEQRTLVLPGGAEQR